MLWTSPRENNERDPLQANTIYPDAPVSQAATLNLLSRRFTFILARVVHHANLVFLLDVGQHHDPGRPRAPDVSGPQQIMLLSLLGASRSAKSKLRCVLFSNTAGRSIVMSTCLNPSRSKHTQNPEALSVGSKSTRSTLFATLSRKCCNFHRVGVGFKPRRWKIQNKCTNLASVSNSTTAWGRHKEQPEFLG